MYGIFSTDSKGMQIFGFISDLILLNIVYLICCIPVITIGAASTALYTVCFRMEYRKNYNVLKTFFSAFKSNFGQGTVIWLIVLLYEGCSAYNIFFFYSLTGAAHNLYIVFSLFAFIGIAILSYAFPLTAVFQNTTKQILYNSLSFTLAYIPRSFLITAVNAFPLLVLIFDPYLYMRIGLLWYIIFYSAAALFNMYMLQKVFTPFIGRKCNMTSKQQHGQTVRSEKLAGDHGSGGIQGSYERIY